MGRPIRARRSPPRQLDCNMCDTRRQAEWCVLNEPEVALLNEQKVTLNFRQGDVIYHQGNPCTGIYSIESGTVGIRRTDDRGHAILLRLAHAGDTIGSSDYFGGVGYTASAETLADATICFIEGATVRALMETNGSLGLQFLVHVARHLNFAREYILQQAYLPVRTRLLHLLLELREHHAALDDQGAITISAPLTRQDMADLLGTRPETIARTFQALERDGILSYMGRTVIIPDLDVLLNEIGWE